jgi:ubiquinone/menaquinone biosynthesis C-methylase UbiE
MKQPKNTQNTSWEKVSSWYDQAVGKTGHYYHEKVILPGVLSLLNLSEKDSLLDLACGQGILSRSIPKSLSYTGIDLSTSLIQSAQEHNVHKNHTFHIGDITKKLPVEKKDFTFCTIILALQNLSHPLGALKNAYAHLCPQGSLLLVMNHPCFRIPKHSGWEIDAKNNLQYRRVDRYLSSLKIPIAAHPSQGDRSAQTPSFHHSLSTWFTFLNQAGFCVESLQEWCSDKTSTGKHAAREDFSRLEFPLFLAIKAIKKNNHK